VSYLSVDAISFQLMTFAHIEANGPVAPESTVRQPKHDQRGNRKAKAQPGLDGLECVSREMRDGGRYVKQRHNTETTLSTTSAGKPASCMTVIGLPWAGRRNRWLMTSAMVSPPTLALSNMKA